MDDGPDDSDASPERSASPGRSRRLLLLPGAAVLLIAGVSAALATVTRPARSAAPAPQPATAAAPARKVVAPKVVAPPRTFTLVAGGDVALVGRGADASTFASIRSFLHGDLVIANLEGTLATGGEPKCSPYGIDGCFTFRASPASVFQLKRAGFTMFTVSNNHAMDYGLQAQLQTHAALGKAHLPETGLPSQITYVHARKVKVALIGAAPYRWAQSLLDIPGTQRLVREAAKRADVVIVYMHAGSEGVDASHVPVGNELFQGEPRGNPRAFARSMIDAGASLVFASGPHTLRGIEWYRGHLIAYSLGNLAGNNTLNTAGTLDLSALLALKMDSAGRLLSGRVIPLRLTTRGTPHYDPAAAAVAFIRAVSAKDFGGRQIRLSRNGTLTVPD